jgi:hypothetical protein
MEIKNAIPKPHQNSIMPAMIFEVDISYTQLHEAIVNVDGWLESDDSKTLVRVEAVPEKAKTSELGARDSIHDSKFTEAVYKATLIARLDSETLKHIEERRATNAKRDVCLTLNLNVNSVIARTVISHFHEIDAQSARIPSHVRVLPDSGNRTEGTILAYGHDSRFSTAFSNRWILSGNGGAVFLAVNNQSIRKEGIRIPSIDWIQDFLPKFRLGEYFVVEIPKGKEVIQGAWNYVNKAEECSRNWDTKGVYANCREAGKLLDKNVTAEFRNNPTIKKWKRAIQKFEYLTSLDLHEEDVEAEEPKGKVRIDKPDVEHILIVTKALVKYAGELLESKS